MKRKISQAHIPSPNLLTLNIGCPTVEDIGPEEYQACEHVETVSKNITGLLAIEHTQVPQDQTRTLMDVYGSLVKLPPGWKWIEENMLCAKLIQCGSKIVYLKSIQVTGNNARYYVKSNEIFHKSLKSPFRSLSELQGIFYTFESLKLCPGVTEPSLLKVETAYCGIRKRNYWRSNLCNRVVFKGRCLKCTLLRNALQTRLTRMDQLAFRKQRKTMKFQQISRKLQRRTTALSVTNNPSRSN